MLSVTENINSRETKISGKMYLDVVFQMTLYNAHSCAWFYPCNADHTGNTKISSEI